MNQTGTTFDVIAIGLALLGVVVAFAISVVRGLRTGDSRLVEVARKFHLI